MVRKFLFYIKFKSSLITEMGTFFMFEFKVIEKLKPNKDLTDILKNFEYTVKLGKIKTILHTNLQVIIPIEYKITYSTTLTILEYKVN